MDLASNIWSLPRSSQCWSPSKSEEMHRGTPVRSFTPSEEQLMDCKSWLAFLGTTKSGGWDQSGKRSLLLQNTWKTGFHHCCPPYFTLTVPIPPSIHWFTILWYGCSHFLTVLPNVEKIDWESVCQVIRHFYSVHGPFQAIIHFKEAYDYLLRSWRKSMRWFFTT